MARKQLSLGMGISKGWYGAGPRSEVLHLHQSRRSNDDASSCTENSYLSQNITYCWTLLPLLVKRG